MALIAAALIERRHEPLYQLATSATNPCDMRRTIELTGLAHRKHYRAQDDFNQRLLAYFDTIPVSKERYQKLSAPAQKQIVQALQRILSPLPMMRSPLVRRERDLDRVEKIIELYEPFILHNEYVFEARNVELLSAALPEDERAPSATTRTISTGGTTGSTSTSRPCANGLTRSSKAARSKTSQGERFKCRRQKRASRQVERGSEFLQHHLMAIFLTGSTGYVGAHVAALLLENHKDKLNLLVRARTEQEAAERLWKSMQLHLDFPRFYEHLQSRVNLYCGDLTEAKFGLSKRITVVWPRLPIRSYTAPHRSTARAKRSA